MRERAILLVTTNMLTYINVCVLVSLYHNCEVAEEELTNGSA